MADGLSQTPVQAAELAFRTLEADAETTIHDLIEKACSSSRLEKSTSVKFDHERLASLCRYLVFLRFRNGEKYCEILGSLKKVQPAADQQHPSSVYGYRRNFVLHSILSFLTDSSVEFLNPVRETGHSVCAADAAFLVNFHSVLNNHCWRLSGADVSIGIAGDDQEFILPDTCFGTLNEGFDEQPDCCDLFFPILPYLALYILGDSNKTHHHSHPFTVAHPFVEVGIESASDVHLRNSMILQTYPQILYFSSLRPVALSISSYDEFRWIKEHPDYSRLKQRCRQKFLQETVTKTLMVKGSVILTDLTEEVTPLGACPVGHGAFSDVWKAIWNDPVEKRSRHVAMKILRLVIVKNVKEKLMKRLQTEVVAWHRLCHRNISQLFGVVRFQNSIGMVSPWCENGTMTDYLHSNIAANRLSLLVQVASGVAYLHSATPVVIHGDLKSGNILVDQYGCPIITDFGLSKVIEELSNTTNITSSFFAGSTRWMAPELVRALIEDDGPPPPITMQSDVYAFASVCLEIATGGLPYPHRSNDHAVTVDILQGVKPSRGAHCLIQFKDENIFWKTLESCWNEAPCLRPTMENIVYTLEQLKLRS